jgi:hypothetical protein
VQGEMEEQIDIVKDMIRKKDGTLPLREIEIFEDLGGIKVKYYELTQSYNDKSYYTLVSNVKPELLDPIELESIDIKITQGSREVLYGYNADVFKVIGNFKNDNAYKWDHMLNMVEWYVSSEKFNMPMPKDENFDINDDIDYYSYYYPIFPKDYILVSNEIVYNFGSHERIFSKLADYGGRHIVFTATPGAKSGKIGKQSFSKPIYVSGLPITDNLIIHFDASFIDSTDNNEVDKRIDSINVKKWIDISSIFGNSAPNESAIVYSTYTYPELRKTEMDTEFIGQYVRFSADQYLNIKDQGTNSKNISFFSVVRNRVRSEDSIYLTNGTHTLNVLAEIENAESDWVISTGSFVSNSDSFVLGGPNIDIAEIVIYDRILSDIETESIVNYLEAKYK